MTLMKKRKSRLEALIWQDVRCEVAAVNPKLAEKIDALNPDDSFVVYKAAYPFGSFVLKDGELQLPNQAGDLFPISSSEIDYKVKENLSYTPNMPIGVVLKHAGEIFWTVGKSIIPFRLMLPGRIFSLWGMLQEPGTSAHTGSMWYITAGARSLMMLPKISDETKYKNLRKKFRIQQRRLKTLSDQWLLFKDLAHSPLFDEDWTVELLYFSKKWFDHIKSDDAAWQLLKLYLLETAWRDTAVARNQVPDGCSFSKALNSRNLRPNPYLVDTVKYLYKIARRAYPGIKVAIDDRVAPIKRFQEIFDETYGLDYAPTMLHIDYFSPKDPLNPVYYSLEFPTLPDFSPKSKKAASKLAELREIKHIQQIIEKYMLNNDLDIRTTPIYKLFSNIGCDYFHNDYDSYKEIRKTGELLELDASLKNDVEKFKKPFCHAGLFFRGCVRIGAKTDDQ